MARPERFERPTPRFVVWCSIQLSYGRLKWRLLEQCHIDCKQDRAKIHPENHPGAGIVPPCRQWLPPRNDDSRGR